MTGDAHRDSRWCLDVAGRVGVVVVCGLAALPVVVLWRELVLPVAALRRDAGLVLVGLLSAGR